MIWLPSSLSFCTKTARLVPAASAGAAPTPAAMMAAPARAAAPRRVTAFMVSPGSWGMDLPPSDLPAPVPYRRPWRGSAHEPDPRHLHVDRLAGERIGQAHPAGRRDDRAAAEA